MSRQAKTSGTVEVTLASTEVLGGEKKRPGDTVTLPADHPVAVKTLGAAGKARVDDGRRD